MYMYNNFLQTVYTKHYKKINYVIICYSRKVVVTYRWPNL